MSGLSARQCARLGVRLRGDDDEATPPEPLTGLQGQSGCSDHILSAAQRMSGSAPKAHSLEDRGALPRLGHSLTLRMNVAYERIWAREHGMSDDSLTVSAIESCSGETRFSRTLDLTHL